MNDDKPGIAGGATPPARNPQARDDSAKTTPAADTQPEYASSRDSPDDSCPPPASSSPPASPAGTAPREGPGRERERERR